MKFSQSCFFCVKLEVIWQETLTFVCNNLCQVTRYKVAQDIKDNCMEYKGISVKGIVPLRKLFLLL